MSLTPKQLNVLQHSMGLDEHGRGSKYRNRFVTDANGADGAVCQSLVALGFMRDHGARQIAGGMHCYSVTPEGEAAIGRESPKPPKRTRGQERYAAFLRADSGLSFREWLKAYAGGSR